MSEQEEKPRTLLHIFRMRSRADIDFIDPQTDIRRLLLVIGGMVAEDMLVVYKDDKDAVADLKYLKNCIQVFRIRVSEDPTPLAEQMEKFIEAIGRIRGDILGRFALGVFVMEVVVYGMYQRRDAGIDGPGQYQMLTLARLADFMEMLPPECADKLCKCAMSHIKERGVTVNSESCAQVEDDNGKVLNVFWNLKERAKMFMEADGDKSWEALAEACDQCFDVKGDELSLQDKAALSLAYPVYGKATQCDVDDETEGNTPREDPPTA